MPKKKPPYRIIVIDSETGEQLHDMPLGYIPFPKRESFYGTSFMQTSQQAVLQIAQDRELRGRPTQVFLGILATVEFDNWIRLSVSELARLLDLQPSNVSRSLKMLADKGVIIRGKKVGTSYLYRLNPAYGYKGSQKNAKKFHLELIQGKKDKDKVN